MAQRWASRTFGPKTLLPGPIAGAPGDFFRGELILFSDAKFSNSLAMRSKPPSPRSRREFCKAGSPGRTKTLRLEIEEQRSEGDIDTWRLQDAVHRAKKPPSPTSSGVGVGCTAVAEGEVDTTDGPPVETAAAAQGSVWQYLGHTWQGRRRSVLPRPKRCSEVTTTAICFFPGSKLFASTFPCAKFLQIFRRMLTIPGGGSRGAAERA